MKEENKKAINELKDFYIPYRNSLGLSKNATFGVEIEFKLKNYSLMNCPSYIYEYDYTKEFMDALGYNMNWEVMPEVNDHIEIISEVLNDENDSWNKLEKVLDFLNNIKAYYSGACGAHVHVGKQLLNNKNSWHNFLKIWSIYEDVIIRFTNGENYFRRRNFDNSSRHCSLEIEKLLNHFYCDDYEIQKTLYNKTSSLNLCIQNICEINNINNYPNNYNVHNTIEFRCPNGTLNKVIWQDNINFFCKLLTACSGSNLDFDLIRYRLNKKIKDDNMPFELCDMVFDNDFDKKCFLRQYYKDFGKVQDYDPLLKSKKFWK